MKKKVLPTKMAAQASDAAALMKALASEHRLLILCELIAEDEMSVSELVSRIGLSQSALSQHLARLRDEGLVSFRRESQTLFYRVRDERAARVLFLLYDIFCDERKNSNLRENLMSRVPQPRNKSVKEC